MRLIPRVLIVDDWADCIELWSWGLQRYGFAVLTTPYPKEALPLARSFQPHVMFVDMLMPDLSGEGVFRLVRADPDTRHIPFVHMSCGCSPDYWSHCMDIGMDAFIYKPMAVEEWADQAAEFTARGILAEAALPRYDREWDRG